MGNKISQKIPTIFVNNNNIIKLGRWNINKNPKEIEIINYWANTDNSGNILYDNFTQKKNYF